MTTIFTRAEREPHCSAEQHGKGAKGQGEVGSQLWVHGWGRASVRREEREEREP